MKFDGAHLDQFQQSCLIFDIQILKRLSVVPEFEGMHIFAEALAGVPLIETAATDSIRAAQQTERMSSNVGKHKRRSRGVISGQRALGDSPLGDNAIRMRDRDSMKRQRIALFRSKIFRGSASGISHDIDRLFIFSGWAYARFRAAEVDCGRHRLARRMRCYFAGFGKLF